jgi:hypothetical protein
MRFLLSHATETFCIISNTTPTSHICPLSSCYDTHIAYAFQVPGTILQYYSTPVLQYQVNVLVLYQVRRTPYTPGHGE